MATIKAYREIVVLGSYLRKIWLEKKNWKTSSEAPLACGARGREITLFKFLTRFIPFPG